MPVLYLTTQGSTLARDGGRLVLQTEAGAQPLLPIALVERVCVLGAVALTPAARSLLLGYRVPVSFLTRRGRLKGSMARHASGASRVGLAQAVAVTLPALTGTWAERAVRRKCGAMEALLAERARRQPSPVLRRALGRLRLAGAGVETARTCDALRGVEGAASAAYYRAFRHLFTGELAFSGTRSRRPPRDPVNALMSLFYTLLVAEAADALAAHGLDPGLGFLHAYRAGRPSLACDLVEPFRSLAADRLVLQLCNRRELFDGDFQVQPDGGFRLTDSALPRVLTAWEAHLQAPVPAYVAAALALPGAEAVVPDTALSLRLLLHAHARATRAGLLAAVDVDRLLRL